MPQLDLSDAVCQLCGRDELDLFSVPDRAEFYLCRDCELYQHATPPICEAEYGLEYNTYADRRSQKLRTAHVRLNRIAALTGNDRSPTDRPLKLLDIGCNLGITLEAARQRGWQAVGIDINPEMADYCQQQGFEAISYQGQQLPFEDQTFDIVTGWHVIEHVNDVRQTLAEWRRVLRPDGILAIETPDASSSKVRLLGRHYQRFWCIEHTYAFTPENLNSFFQQTGFDILRKPIFGNLFQLQPTQAAFAIGYQMHWAMKQLIGCRKAFQIFARRTEHAPGVCSKAA